VCGALTSRIRYVTAASQRPRLRGRRPSAFAACLGALAALVLPPSARAVGTPGCGTFYQDKACREDCGSCGQPCCALEWEIALPAVETRNRIMARVFNASSGFDGRFSLESVDPAEAGTLKTCRAQAIKGPSDKGDIDCVMIKGAHRPQGKRQQKFQDEISLAVFAVNAGSCRLKGFSRSRFITSHCDEGENYHTLEQIILSLGLTSYVQTSLYGCPQK